MTEGAQNRAKKGAGIVLTLCLSQLICRSHQGSVLPTVVSGEGLSVFGGNHVDSPSGSCISFSSAHYEHSNIAFFQRIQRTL
jgi:hypothetical protein